jgi:hypothetical protein
MDPDSSLQFAQPLNRRRTRRRPLRAFLRGVRVSLLFLLLAWASLAIHFSNLPWPTARTVLAVAFAAFGVWALWIARRRGPLLLLAALFAVVVLWWSTIEPSHDLKWRAEMAVMPRVEIDGDRYRISGVRNFDFRSVEDFTPRYETRELSLDRLKGVDFYISYWMPGPVGHTFLSFNFEDEPPLSISIEARQEEGEGYDPLGSLFKQFELIYVVGNERDIVRLRTNFRREDVFLYRIQTSKENARRLFMVYMDRINQLADRPEFYHLLSNSCTVNIVRYANVVGRQGGFDFRHLLNGLIDGYLYNADLLPDFLPLDELRRRSHINQAAVAAGDTPEFPQLIRASLPY